MFNLDKSLESEVANNRNNLRIGDHLLYIDCENCARYEITELFEGGFEVKAISGTTGCEIGETEDFFFASLQKGWLITDSTKEYNKLYFKTQYAA